MRKNCDIVKDLLPLYVENLTSKSSNAYIEKHIQTCDECMGFLKNIEKELPTIEEPFEADDYEDQEIVKSIKKRMSNRTFITAALGVLVGLLLSMNFFPWASIGLIGFLLFLGAIVYLLY